MAQFIQDPEILKVDVILYQEPWKNLYQNTIYHPAKDTYKLLWLAGPEKGTEEDKRVRVCIFVSKKLSGWQYIEHSRDMQELYLKIKIDSIPASDLREISLFNVYNEFSSQESLTLLRTLLPARREQRRGSIYLVMGDFNLYYLV